jgi:hypothetical protein
LNWEVDYADALEAFLDRGRGRPAAEAVRAWIGDTMEYGPPDNAMEDPTNPGRYLARINYAGNLEIIADFLVDERRRRMIIFTIA